MSAIQQLLSGSLSQYWLSTWIDDADASEFVGTYGGLLATDGNTNVISAGDQVRYDGSSWTSQAAVVKQTAVGEFVWARQLTPPTGFVWAEPHALTVDTAGNICVAGTVINSAGSDTKIFVAKYNTSGALQWQREISYSTGIDTLNDMCVDTSGNLFICGNYNGYTTAFVAKLNSSGVIQWQKQLALYTLYGVAVDTGGAIYIVGRDASTIGRILKLDSTGAITWDKHLTATDTRLYGVTVDGSGNVYVCGDAGGSGDMGLVKLSSVGALTWGVTVNDPAAYGGRLRKCALSPDGDVFITGAFEGPPLFYGFLAKLSSAGSAQWQRSVAYAENTWGVAFQSGAVLIGAKGDPDVGQERTLVAKLPIDGTLSGAYTIDGSEFTYEASSYGVASWTPTIGTGSLSVSAAALAEAAGTMADTEYIPTVALVKI